MFGDLFEAFPSPKMGFSIKRIRILSIFSKSSRYLEAVFTSLIITRETKYEVSLITKQKYATRGAQLVPFGILTICNSACWVNVHALFVDS